MKVLSLFVIFLFLSSLGTGICVDNATGENGSMGTTNISVYGSGCRYNVQGWVFVHIEGDPYERGYQYGYLLAPEIVDMIQRWSHIIHNAPVIGGLTGDLSSPSYLDVSERWWEYCKSSIVKMYWEDYPLEYQKEIEGIADGVTDNGGQMFGHDVTYEDILAINEMYEFITKITNPPKGIHFLRTVFNGLRQLLPGLSSSDEDLFVSSFIDQSQAHHCTGFIATGDATTEGQIVVTQATWFGSSSWWFNAYIAERWNVIVDLQPTNGNRLLFTTSPGYIWSDENYYHNDKGLVMVDTTAPQGIWARDGLPLAGRTRKAAQYGESIDDVISNLLQRNDGVWTAVWLIGDIKTGEIARMDLGLYHYGLWRTHDGFYWSANNIMDPRVRSERRLGTLKGRALQILGFVYPTTGWYEYYTREYHPNPRDIKFEELGEEYYGEIDSEWVKEIMSVSPFTDFSSDTKVSDSFLIAQNGLWLHYGNPGGIIWNTTHLDGILPGGSIFPPTGWMRIYGIPTNFDFSVSSNVASRYGDAAAVIWEQDLADDNPENTRYAYSAASADMVYTISSSGVVHAFDLLTGSRKWIKDLGDAPRGSPSVDDRYLTISTKNGLYVLNKTTGNKYWEKSLDCVSPPVVANGNIIVGCQDQLISFELPSGVTRWVLETPYNSYPSLPWKTRVFVGTGSSCWAVDIQTGEIKWVYETAGPITASPGICSQGNVYVGSWDTYLYAIDGETGENRWMFPTGWGIDTTPSISDDKVFVGAMDNNFYAIDSSTGDLIWTYTCQASIHSSPLPYGDYVFFGCDDGRFYALNQTTGMVAWSFSPGYSLQNDVYTYLTTPIVSDPIVVNRTMLLGVKGKLYALDAQTSKKMVDEDTSPFSISSFTEAQYATVPALLLLGCIAVISFLFWDRKKKKGR